MFFYIEMLIMPDSFDESKRYNPLIYNIIYFMAGGINGFIQTMIHRRFSSQQTDPPVEPTEDTRKGKYWSVFYREVPIDGVGDDRLGFRTLADSIRRFLDNTDTKPPLSIAFNGPWGSGKSSLMRLLTSELEQTGRFHCIWFNAWRQGKEESILAALLTSIRDHIIRKEGFWFRLRMAYVRMKSLSFLQWFLVFAVLLALFHSGAVTSYVESMIINNTDWFDVNIISVRDQKFISSFFAIVAGIIFLWNKSKPFHLPIKRLFSARDVSARTGFINQFVKEFELFRQASGGKKLLVAIDDLDRCPPEMVVNVLKSINLILTGESGQTEAFFLMGYDRDYVLQSISRHYKGWLGKDDNSDEFSRQYLKKMVTLAVSVPEASHDGKEGLARELEHVPQSQQQSTSVRKTIQEVLTTNRFATNFLPAAFIVLLTYIGLLWFSMDQSLTDSTDSDIVTFVLNQQKTEYLVYLLYSAMMLLAAVFILTPILQRFLGKQRDDKYTEQAKDPEVLVTSVKDCVNALPANPRDLIRAVNAMRLNFLIQEHDPEYSGPKLYANSPLTQWQSVTLSLLAYSYPDLFSLKVLQEYILPQCDGTNDPASVYGEAAKEIGLDDQGVYRDIFGLIDSFTGHNEHMKHLLDKDCIERFISVHKHTLQKEPCTQGNTCSIEEE